MVIRALILQARTAKARGHPFRALFFYLQHPLKISLDAVKLTPYVIYKIGEYKEAKAVF